MNITASNQRVAHHAKGSEYFVIFLVNVLLTILTLGIYSFWAKARSRRYLWSQSSFDDERFEYTGTGMETFIGFIKAFGILLLVALAAFAVGWVLSLLFPPLFILPIVLLYFFVLFVGPLLGLYGAKRYMSARTRYRGIRFSLDGSSWAFVGKAIGHGLLTVLSLSLYAPYAGAKLHSYITNNSKFGSEPFRFEGTGGPMFKPFVISLLLTIPTLGFVWLWYGVKRAHYYASQTYLGDLSFKLDMPLGAYIGLVLTNLLFLVLSLGLAYPWIVIRSNQFFARHLVVNGQLDYDSIGQSATNASATEEGLAQVFEVDSFG